MAEKLTMVPRPRLADPGAESNRARIRTNAGKPCVPLAFVWLAFLSCLFWTSTLAAAGSILHMHEHPNPGRPYGAPVMDGSGYLYGTTYLGGPTSLGTISRIRVDGTGEEVLHWFMGGPDDGSKPYAALVLDGSGYLYGVTYFGGAADAGTIFKIRTDGTGFQLLYSFDDYGVNGLQPDNALVLDSSGYLYGVTYHGGSSWLNGAVFRIKTDGTGFRVLHNFTGDPTDGANPFASLILDGSGYLYGTTEYGGAGDSGTVFKMKTDGTGFQILHSFSISMSDGLRPWAPLTLDASGTLYGTTTYGGSNNAGTVFLVKTDGTGFRLLHSFIVGDTGGANPKAGLLLASGGNLYGTTNLGGSFDRGTIFTIKTDGSGFAVRHTFAGYPGDAQHPVSPLIADSSGTFFGATPGGGTSNHGTVYKMRPDGTGFQVLYSFLDGESDGMSPWAGLILDGSRNLYGTTYGGGVMGLGTVFKIRPDGSGFQVLHSFMGGSGEGRNPYASLVLDGSGNLYGTTFYGGWSDLGTVFKVRTDGTGFQILHSFAGGASDGSRPRASLIPDGLGNLYGTAAYGGSTETGTVFSLRSDGTGYRVLHFFAGGANDGSNPYAALCLDGSGNLFGTTYGGGSSNTGTVFTLRTDGTGFQLLRSFKGGTTDGSRPYATLILDPAGYLYGTTYGGGTANIGTMFKMKSDGTLFELLRSFKGGASDGSRPYSGLIPGSTGILYGTTFSGGQTNDGTVFRVATDGTGFQLLHIFAHGQFDGSNPAAPPVRDSTGNLYGTTVLGGIGDFGTEFVVPDPCGVTAAPVIRAPAAVVPVQSFKASVTAVAGMTYWWTVAGSGTLTSGQGTSSITVTSRTAGTITVKATATSSNGCVSPDASVQVSVVEPAKLLLLQGGKVSVLVTWRSQYSGQTGTATAIPKADQYGYFYFSDANNPELFVKVLDFGASSPYLLFWAGLTDFEYTVAFTNTSTWKSASFSKPAGSTAGGASTTDLPHVRAVFWDADADTVRPISNGESISDGAGALAGLGRHDLAGIVVAPHVETIQGHAGPAADSEILLAKAQVAVSVTWRSQYSGQTGTATPIPQKDEFCFFYFSSAENPEVFVKVLDWGSPGPFKVFAAGLTDFEYAVTFRNVKTGATLVFRKPASTYDGYAANMER